MISRRFVETTRERKFQRNIEKKREKNLDKKRDRKGATWNEWNGETARERREVFRCARGEGNTTREGACIPSLVEIRGTEIRFREGKKTERNRGAMVEERGEEREGLRLPFSFLPLSSFFHPPPSIPLSL